MEMPMNMHMTTTAATPRAFAIEQIDRHTSRVTIVGELDVQTTVEAATGIVRLRSHPPTTLLIDATDATFVDSSGITALTMLALAVRGAGGTVTTIASPAVRRVISLCKIETHLGLEPLDSDRPTPSAA
jgi:anti-anti-sigma factor